jgi:hypothetical protein
MSPTLAARRARIQRIRRTVTAAAVAVFIALFATIYIQMASGRDPALGTTATASVTTGTSSGSASGTTSSSDDKTSSSAITTSQS